MSNKIDMLNKRFGALRVISQAGTNKCGQLLWQCYCDCGQNKIVNGCDLRSGKINNCGCQKERFKNIQNGGFDNKEEAAIARNIAAIEYFGEYAYLNFPYREEAIKGKAL